MDFLEPPAWACPCGASRAGSSPALPLFRPHLHPHPEPPTLLVLWGPKPQGQG